jgi:hypothetical protein
MPNTQKGALDQVDRKIHLYSDRTLSVGEAKSLAAKGAALNRTLTHYRAALATGGRGCELVSSHPELTTMTAQPPAVVGSATPTQTPGGSR